MVTKKLPDDNNIGRVEKASIVGFYSVQHFPGLGDGSLAKSLHESRLVILPQHQGLGLGPSVSNTFASLITKNGFTVFSSMRRV